MREKQQNYSEKGKLTRKKPLEIMKKKQSNVCFCKLLKTKTVKFMQKNFFIKFLVIVFLVHFFYFSLENSRKTFSLNFN